jgi:hypothetical protein
MRFVPVVAVALGPVLAVLALLALARAAERARDARRERQVVITDAIHRELGAVVAPVVEAGVLGPWRLRIAVPLDRPALVGRVVAIARDALPDHGRGVQIVLVQQAAPRAGR